MNICFYAPFKPLTHPAPSGDQRIGAGIYRFLTDRGHHLWTVSTLRCRWIFLKPWRIPELVRERRRAARKMDRLRPDLWLTYHTYYKAPDVLGPWVCRKTGVPYVIFQGVFSTKRRRRLKTWPGYMLNTLALQTAGHVFTNKRKDLRNLERMVPGGQLTYVTPGIVSEDFGFSENHRRALRSAWQAADAPVVLSAAMFRPGVKTQGLALVIRACGRLFQSGKRFYLVIAGDGREKRYLEALGERHLPGRVRFVGQVPREEMHRFYSAGDIFAFPGIRESLGMVFLEAQSCGLPVVAFANGGTPEVIVHGKTGLLVPAFDPNAFERAVGVLLDEPVLRGRMGRAGSVHVRERHDLNRNYRILEAVLERIVRSSL